MHVITRTIAGKEISSMTTFTIDSDDHIAIATPGGLKPEGADHFSSFGELRQVAAPWSASRLVRLWNGLPGITPVKRFTDRKTALTRIWKALDNGSARSTTRAKTSPKSAAHAKTTGVRAGTKKAQVIRMLQRSNGASIAEIMRVTNWQPHTVRGFISRALVHDLGLKVIRFKRDHGQPAYRLPR
jgi:hypothetical protein